MINLIILFVFFLSCVAISVLVFNKEDFKHIKFIQNTHKIIFPVLSLICIVLILAIYSSDTALKKNDLSIMNNDSYDTTEIEEDTESVTDYENTEYEDTDFTVNEPEEVTLYTGVHIGGADILAGSYIASTTSNSGGNLFVYDDSHFLAYHEFYESGYSENKEGSLVYIDDGSEIKITGVSSVTFTPVGN
ncbi:hypothetical protein [Mammaliicoccus sciuri]|uniref:hypothetical protein n=1 Tax=Mammaliicoccus sciuri TaxID=1296 RepID=UPI000D1F4289|nr:hypothetical protein [Mammaliicoccus sciuri]PTJ99647.1 hypothetical protein BUZ87_13675 [Mammaliicoccus sciuri]